MNKLCSICGRNTESETSSILVMGGYGNPKYLCDEGAVDFDEATTAADYDNIKAAMDKIGAKLTENNTDDETVLRAVEEIFSEAGERAEKIKEGTYDFSEDEKNDEVDDIPEELLESEEDKALDEKEAKSNKLFDRIFNWVFAVALIGVVAYFVIKFLY